MRILIDNCVPLNNGDAALIFSIGKKFEKKNMVIYNTNNINEVSKLYPKYNWSRSLLDKRIYRILWKLLPFFNKIIFFFPIILNKEYRKADAVVSAPGGYIHSYYGIEFRMYILYLCKKVLKKKVGIYSQSIGNLSKKDIKRFVKYGKNLDFIFVRDQISYERIMEYDEFTNVYLTKDAAFMLEHEEFEPIKNKEKSKIAISVRAWDKEGRSQDMYFGLIKSIVELCLQKDFEIVFISTCQGIKDYVDDSKTAEKILNSFGLSDNPSVVVDHEYHTLDELQEILKSFDFVIGTRLHMCILSLINSVPALNISYEEKGRATYDYLGLADYTIDYNAEKDISEKLEHFFEIDFSKTSKLSKRIENVIDEQQAYFEIAERLIYGEG